MLKLKLKGAQVKAVLANAEEEDYCDASPCPLATHRYKADESYCVGQGETPVGAYLKYENIIATAKSHGVQAGPDTHSPPRHRMPFNSRNQGV